MNYTETQPVTDIDPATTTVNGISFNLYIEAIVTKVLAEQAIREARTLAGLENRPPDPPDPRSDEERTQAGKERIELIRATLKERLGHPGPLVRALKKCGLA